MSPSEVWQHFYQQAILETDRSRLPVLIRSARAAIDVRIEQLKSEMNDSAEERQALADALTNLRVLTEELPATDADARQ
jgi:hypothetical protein